MYIPQVILSVFALALVGLLYQLPKSVVHGKSTSLPTDSTASNLPAEHQQTNLASSDQAALSGLQARYQAATGPDAQFSLADSLATLLDRLSRPDSAAFYRAQQARLRPSAATVKQAGDAYYAAFQFAANAAKARGLGEKVRYYYQKVLEQNPTDLEIKSRMAMTYVATDTPMQGIMLLRDVLAQDPQNRSALLNIGLLSMQSGQYDKALSRFEALLLNHPDDEEAQLYRGISYLAMGRKEEGRQALQEVKNKATNPSIQQTASQYLEQENEEK